MSTQAHKLLAIAAATVAATFSSIGGAAARPAPTGPGLPHSIVTTRPVVARGHNDLVGAGATGTGPATEGDCEAYANAINSVLGLAQTELQTHGNGAYYNQLIDAARAAESEAEDEGCFIINPV